MDNQNKLYVGGLPYSVTDEKLSEIFSKFGEIVSAKVIVDKFTGRSKGFGFVEFGSEKEAQKAIKEMDGSELEGRKIIVNVARPMEERKPY